MAVQLEIRKLFLQCGLLRHSGANPPDKATDSCSEHTLELHQALSCQADELGHSKSNRTIVATVHVDFDEILRALSTDG